MENDLLLAGDIGGTKTILALFSTEKGPLEPLYEATFPSGGYPGLDSIISDFHNQAGSKGATACFGVAGPVRDGRAVITNLPWQPDSRMLQEAHGFSRATLINDLAAMGYSIPHLPQPDLAILNEGINVPWGGLGIIAPGTGLGEAIFTWDGSRYIAVPSEGGHSDFAPGSELEMELLYFLKKRSGHVSFDRVCSGRGLPGIYDFLKEHLQLEEPAWLMEELATAEDRAPVIVNGAMDDSRKCEICLKTVQVFVSVLGAEAGNLALKGLTTGGMYLGGGIPLRILPFLQQDIFMKSFRDKGRMSYLLSDIPVTVILNPRAALIGAAAFGLGIEFDALQ